MSRLGLAGRLMLFIALALFVAQLLAVAGYLSERRVLAPERLNLPFPDQLEALVLLIESSPPEQQSLLVRALSGNNLRLDVQPVAEDDTISLPRDGEVVLPGLGRWLEAYSGVLGARQVVVSVPAEDAGRRLRLLRLGHTPERLRVSVRLMTGSWLHVQRLPSPAIALGGLPVGLISALLSTLAALVAMLVVWLETRPLRALAQAVTAFGRDLHPRPQPVPRPPDLRALVQAFNTMQEAIARAEQGRSDMIAALSHDIRTPLARLALRLRKLAPAQRAAAERDIAQIDRVAGDAFRFTEVQMARLDEWLDLRSLLADLAQAMEVAFEDRLGAAGAPLHGSAELLRRAFGNLIDNGFKHGAGTVRLVAQAVPGGYAVVVEDDGPGIAVQDRARLLEPFQRGDPARAGAVAGSGLGLALAQRIVARHGGTLGLESAASGGLAVRLFLPAPPP